MKPSISTYLYSRRIRFALGAFAITGMTLLASCATENSTEPNPARTPDNTTTVDEFFTPAPNGDADDYYLLGPGEDDIEYSYFLDEEDYFKARDYDKDDKHDQKYYFWIKDKVKGGHGYGDHNHIHIHLKGPHNYHGIYIGIRQKDWTDSIALTDSEKVRIDTAMRDFDDCSRATLDSFKVQMKPYRDEFRTTRLAIIAELDSNLVTRDSARELLDSAIVKYETETDLMRAGIEEDLKGCRTDLDLAIQTILTPTQYAIWTRHRGW